VILLAWLLLYISRQKFILRVTDPKNEVASRFETFYISSLFPLPVSTSQPRKSSERDPLREHELVKKLVKDGKPVDYLTIRGYVGKSDSVDAVRLYLSKEFNEYIEVKKKEILHAEEISAEELEFGGTCIWIDKDTEIIKVKVQFRKQQARFMEGDIVRTQLRPEAILRARQGDQWPSLFGPVCPTEWVPCTYEWFCQPQNATAYGPYCPHPTPGCPTPGCPTPRVFCPSPMGLCPHTPDCPVFDPDLGADPTIQLKLQLDKLRAKVKKLEDEKE